LGPPDCVGDGVRKDSVEIGPIPVELEPAPPLVVEEDVRVMVGRLEAGTVVVIKVEERPPPPNDMVQVFSSLTRISPLAPVIGVITMVHVCVNIPA